MSAYIWKKLLAVVPLLLAVSIISFLISVAIEKSSSSIAVEICGEGAPPTCVGEVEAELGIDQPVMQRYIGWLGNVVTGDLGNSLKRPVSVMSLIGELSLIHI